MMTEEAARDNRVTLFAAVYDGNVEPAATLKRTQRIELHFRKAEDRASIVRHRLSKMPTAMIRIPLGLLFSHTSILAALRLEVPDSYISRMETAFPFLPD